MLKSFDLLVILQINQNAVIGSCDTFRFAESDYLVKDHKGTTHTLTLEQLC